VIGLWASLPFDSVSEHREIEDGVLIRLAGLMRENGGFLFALEPYNGEIDERDGVDDFYRELIGRAPAVLVSTSAGRYRSQSVRATEYRHDVTIEILAVSNSLRGHTDRTRGEVGTGSEDAPTGDPGIYHMVAAVRRLLMGRSLGIAEAGRLRPVSSQVLFQVQGGTAWRLVYRVQVRVAQVNPVIESEMDDAEIAEIQARHFFRDELTDSATLVATATATQGDG
jgi:Domain of unknown function (DUF1834).